MKKLSETNLLFAVVFFLFIFVGGAMADINLYRFKVLGESSSNYEYIEEEKGNLQAEYIANFPYKVLLVDINGFARKIMGQREMNGVVKLKNGHLTAVDNVMNEDCLEKNSQAIIQFNEYCKEQEIRLIFVQPAYKISKYDDQLPPGVEDGHNQTMDRLLDLISSSGVETLDLRQIMHDENINPYDFYYRTDHHWNTQGAFYAYTKIAPLIKEQTNTTLDEELLDLDNYIVETYPEWHLGARGQRTGTAFAGIDNYDLIYPGFETHIFNQEDETVNNLKDSMVRQEIFLSKDTKNRYTYDWAYGKNEINSLISKDAQTDLSVLLLSDSFKHALNPYFLLTYKEYNEDSYTTLSTAMLQKYNPDVVIILPWPGNFSENSINFTFVDDMVTE